MSRRNTDLRLPWEIEAIVIMGSLMISLIFGIILLGIFELAVQGALSNFLSSLPPDCARDLPAQLSPACKPLALLFWFALATRVYPFVKFGIVRWFSCS